MAKVKSNYFGKNNPHWKGGKPKCIDCGKQLSKYKAKRCKSCSRKGKTAVNWIEKGMIGKNSPFWKGGAKNSQAERVKFHETIRNEVLKRDNYICQLCDKRGGKLQVDHIQEWAEYVEGRFNINNCRTLCMSCHYKLTFGRELPRGVIWGHNFSQKVG